MNTTPRNLVFTIPGPPVSKERPRRAKNGHWYTPSKTQRYEKDVETLARAAGAFPTPNFVKVEIWLFMPDARRRDLDNAAKTILDGLNGVAFGDDAQIVELHVAKAIDRQHPRATVCVSEVLA